ncbi:hypothetical protein [Streptomyces avermitilis]|uniref:hypothetical protein n=1 Tax=Streptomyces avermitilis TaxID=33903 RepID=UPI0033A3FE07
MLQAIHTTEDLPRHAETSMLALHLLQSSLVHVNTLLLQQVLTEPGEEAQQ